MKFFHSRRWILGRRIALIVVALFVGYQSYGEFVSGWLRGPDPARDLVITESEFRPGAGGDAPLWFIGLINQSGSAAYDRILIEATYTDASGRVTETDRIVLNQRLGPGEERLVGSRDAKLRPGAISGSLHIVGAEAVD